MFWAGRGPRGTLSLGSLKPSDFRIFGFQHESGRDGDAQSLTDRCLANK